MIFTAGSTSLLQNIRCRGLDNSLRLRSMMAWSRSMSVWSSSRPSGQGVLATRRFTINARPGNNILQPCHSLCQGQSSSGKSTDRSLIILRHFHATHSVGDTENNNKENAPESQSVPPQEKEVEEPPVIIYETPFPGLILRLRAVSWFTGVGGLVAFPLTYAAQSGDPSTVGFWVISLTFGMATMSTTAAVTFLFRPYVFKIERVPMNSTITAVPSEQEEHEGQTKDASSSQSSSTSLPYLYKAYTRSTFLFPEEYLFDPTTQLKPYSGLTQPLCNMQIHYSDTDDKSSSVGLYVHPEAVTDRVILKVLGEDAPKPVSKATNPEEEVLKKK